MSIKKTPEHIKLDERHHVKEPLLEQLQGPGWDIIDLTDKQQKPSEILFYSNCTFDVLHQTFYRHPRDSIIRRQQESPTVRERPAERLSWP